MAVSRNYFQKFPSISYNDYVVRDISLRTKLSQYLLETGIALLPYTIKEGERADNIASFYYNDPYYAWAIYLVNGIIDPYSEWPKDSRTLQQYIEQAYGSVEAAMDTILRYEVDWASDTTLLTPDQYDALPSENKKYWQARTGYNGRTISYFRREVDWVLDNNRLDQVTVVSNSSTNSIANAFTVGERTYQYNYLDDIAVKSTVISVDSTTDANVVNMKYSNSSFYDITFSSGNTFVFVKSSSKILPKATITGTNIPSGTYVKHVVNGTHLELSAAPSGSPASNSTYSFGNPATATITLQKVDFSDVTFASTSELAAPDTFFTYEYEKRVTGDFVEDSNVVSNTKPNKFSAGQIITISSGDGSFDTTVSSTNSTHIIMAGNSTFTGTGTIYYGQYLEYHDEGNYLVGRKNGANVVVLSHIRLDTNTEPLALLSNSQLSINELPYWKSISAYDEELTKNELKKEIYVLDVNAINSLDNNLEALLKNG